MNNMQTQISFPYILWVCYFWIVFIQLDAEYRVIDVKMQVGLWNSTITKKKNVCLRF